ncbi:MAG: pyridoxal 5'-phosphate synthase glutaminase subunit PdxT [Clostridiales bacterium]|jgi:5'-phosphate synthase pdxT subunit|nr:pyridoxal 5'-phosphate synthase glutaminase subunit PdxT [Clostridiales bacterium]
MKLGVLALQGAFEEHIRMLARLGVEAFEIRGEKDLLGAPADGYILPGGESTVMGKLLCDLGLLLPLKERILEGIPVFGTCAGLLLLAKSIVNDSAVYFGVMDIAARRNAYGRQLGSFTAKGTFGSCGDIPMTFIRAPYIESWGEQVEILSRVNGFPVAARQKNILVTAFHPELTDCTTVHQYFIDMVKRSRFTHV